MENLPKFDSKNEAMTYIWIMEHRLGVVLDVIFSDFDLAMNFQLAYYYRLLMN